LRFFCRVMLYFVLPPQVRDILVRVSHGECVEGVGVSVVEN
jgi:hypothetical protein